MTNPPALTVFPWLEANGLRLGGLTDHDARALKAAVQVADLWICGDKENRIHSAGAFRRCVLQMQPAMYFAAFHATAHVGDWTHRALLWQQALLPHIDNLPPCSGCRHDYQHA